MIRFRVTVRTLTTSFTYPAIGRSSWEVADHALDLFSVCSVSVRVVNGSL